MTHSKRFVVALLASLAASTACAQSWPSKPVRVIVPYPAGGVVDVQTRAVTTRMAADLGQPVIVEARPGANGNIAAEAIARSPADGYSLLVSAGFFVNNPFIETDMKWKPADFAPVARFALSPSFIVVPTNAPGNTLREWVDYAKSKPGLPVGDGGVGTPQTMALIFLANAAGLEFNFIAYKGAPPMVPDLINGLLQMTASPSTVALPVVKSGKLKALANSSDKRSPLLPDVPTIAEAGFPDATVLSWYGFHVPAGTPPDVIRRIAAAVGAAANSQEVRDRLANAGGESAFLGTEEFIAFLKADSARAERYSKLVKK